MAARCPICTQELEDANAVRRHTLVAHGVAADSAPGTWSTLPGPPGQPGWHPDPWNSAALRYWDGSQWSGKTAPLGSAPDEAVTQKRRWGRGAPAMASAPAGAGPGGPAGPPPGWGASEQSAAPSWGPAPQAWAPAPVQDPNDWNTAPTQAPPDWGTPPMQDPNGWTAAPLQAPNGDESPASDSAAASSSTSASPASWPRDPMAPQAPDGWAPAAPMFEPDQPNGGADADRTEWAPARPESSEAPAATGPEWNAPPPAGAEWNAPPPAGAEWSAPGGVWNGPPPAGPAWNAGGVPAAAPAWAPGGAPPPGWGPPMTPAPAPSTGASRRTLALVVGVGAVAIALVTVVVVGASSGHSVKRVAATSTTTSLTPTTTAAPAVKVSLSAGVLSADDLGGAWTAKAGVAPLGQAEVTQGPCGSPLWAHDVAGYRSAFQDGAGGFTHTGTVASAIREAPSEDSANSQAAFVTSSSYAPCLRDEMSLEIQIALKGTGLHLDGMAIDPLPLDVSIAAKQSYVISVAISDAAGNQDVVSVDHVEMFTGRYEATLDVTTDTSLGIDRDALIQTQTERLVQRLAALPTQGTIVSRGV